MILFEDKNNLIIKNEKNKNTELIDNFIENLIINDNLICNPNYLHQINIQLCSTKCFVRFIKTFWCCLKYIMIQIIIICIRHIF